MISVLAMGLFVAYAGLVILLTVGWTLASKPSVKVQRVDSDNRPLISIVVAARNEEQCLPSLLNDLRAQQYVDFEVIIIDDHSEDRTSQICQKAAESDPRIRSVVASGVGKKAALSQGVGLSQGTIIVSTDADCRVGPHWLEAWTHIFIDDSVMLGFGAVSMTGPTRFDRIQAMEFATLVGAGAATATLGKPTMCNGANLAFRRSAFVAVKGYAGNEQIPSGDDEFLMRKIESHFPGSIRYCADSNVLVKTGTLATLPAFVQQRIRWAGKWKCNSSTTSKLLAVGVFCLHLCVLALPILLVTDTIKPSVVLLCILLKFFAEFFFLCSLRPIILSRWSWVAFFVLQLVYSGYVVGVALWSQFSGFQWKGRRLKPLMASGN